MILTKTKITILLF